MSLSPLPTIRKAQKIQGRTLIFRDAKQEDVAFILGLRTDSEKSRYLSTTDVDLEKQKNWLNHYAEQTDQAYFIIESLKGEPLGTVRLCDAHEHSFCWGSWILKAGAPQTVAIESALMVYAYVIDYLKFQAANFDVRKGNESVWRFHERFGALRTSETSMNFSYKIYFEGISTAQNRYKKYLPQLINITL